MWRINHTGVNGFTSIWPALERDLELLHRRKNRYNIIFYGVRMSTQKLFPMHYRNRKKKDFDNEICIYFWFIHPYLSNRGCCGLLTSSQIKFEDFRWGKGIWCYLSGFLCGMCKNTLLVHPVLFPVVSERTSLGGPSNILTNQIWKLLIRKRHLMSRLMLAIGLNCDIYIVKEYAYISGSSSIVSCIFWEGLARSS